jgi:hypothetical protein
MQTLPSQCDSCANRINNTTCLAFPQGIPEDFLLWANSHNTPTKSQKNAIVWEFAPGTEQEFQTWKDLVEA